MKKAILLFAAASFAALTACNRSGAEAAAENTAAGSATCTGAIAVADCHIEFDGVNFTRSLNGGDSLVTVADSTLTFRCGPGRDLFNDPDGKLSSHSVPAIMTEIDNTLPFTLSARVTPGFTPDGTYNAAELLVFACDTLYQKLCFEQDERGRHRVVSVRTAGTSDDNNHDVIGCPDVYLKISSDTRTIASYYSLDGKEWQMVRLYRNSYPARILVGIASQSPKKDGCTSSFTDLCLRQDNVADFRMGN